MSTYDPATGPVDIIFAGGGTAACVAAGRLAKANPELKILLVEGGRNNFQDPTVTNPAVYLSHLARDSKTALFYKSNASPHLNNREAIVPAGGILGGGSSINFMMYTRAQGADFDSWDTPGWSAADMLPVCNKLETYHVKGETIDQSKHGHEGPVHVSDGGYSGKSQDGFAETVEGMGYRMIEDLQDFDAVGGLALVFFFFRVVAASEIVRRRWARYVSPDGKRQDSAHRYIHPLLESKQYPNLHILLEAKVIRVLFDEESSPPRAIGIEYKTNEEHQPTISLSKPVPKTIKASKLVVVTAGALGTPQILERSGVGNPDILKPLNIPVVADVPGVGENYQDHQLLLYPYKTTLDPSETLDGILSGRKDFVKALGEKDPMLGWNGIVSAFLADPSLVAPGQYITMGTYTAYPFSRGSIHITSPDDVLTGYSFDTGFLSHPSDLKAQLWAYKMSREIGRRLPYFDGELELGHPQFGAGSVAGLGKGRDGDGEVKDLVYSAEDDAAIEDWIRGNLNTTWHSLGTCAMRERGRGGVVDRSLNVYGTVGLKVADLSMVPENVGANTNNTALAVGEKAAMIIAGELGVEV
ncbi:Alcohol oxidase [Lachnellula arida]|uniref:Alcohol oxidase n=1 Tax=Lachnellula arida TaxID=1316785 RepID=A0A8T9BKL6_9HELO|nr:Alcohol oxidase [Lachnellula arida]